MPQGRPAIPAETDRAVRIRARHRCSVDGNEVALDIAHIDDWAASQDHSLENLLLLCANCHRRAHTEKWDRKTLRFYRDHPFIHRDRKFSRTIRHLRYATLGNDFVGREDTLVTLHEHLTAGHATALKGHAIYGMGGVGKTRAVIEYAWRFAAEYSALLFVEADSPESLSRNLAALCAATILDLPEKDAREQDLQEAAVLRWLQSHEHWLLILDNADTDDALAAVEKLLPGLSNGHVLLTTRQRNLTGSFTAVPLDVLSESAAVAYLLQRTDGFRAPADDDEAQALALTRLLDGLALALEQAASFIRQTGNSFAAYITRWQSNTAAALAWHDEKKMHYPRSLAVTYETSVAQLSEPAKELFRILSWFAPDPIPFSIMESEHAPENARALLAELENLSLARRREDGTAFTVHRLIQEITRQQQSSPPPALVTALFWINGLFPFESDDVRFWPVAEPLAPHAHTVALCAADSSIPEPTGRLLCQVGLLCYTKAQYQVAEPLFRRAIDILENKGGTPDPQYPAAANNLAQLLRTTNRLAESEPLMRRALAINEAGFGKDHPKVAIDLNNLASLLRAMNRLTEAESLFVRAVRILENKGCDPYPNYTGALNNLAQLLQATNRRAEAEPLMRRALAIDEVAFGKGHPQVGIGLNNLSGLLLATNRLPEAEPLMRRALAIFEESLGYSHPNVGVLLNNLAQLLQATNRRAEAEPLMRRALAIDEASLGKDHPSVAVDLNNLAQLLKGSNRLAEAEPLMRRPLEIFVSFTVATGHRHPHLQAAINNYRILLKEMGDTEAQAREKIAKILEPIRNL